MKRPFRLVLWLFLLLTQQKITVAIPLRNELWQHNACRRCRHRIPHQLAARATGLPKRPADLPLTAKALASRRAQSNHKAIDAQQLR